MTELDCPREISRKIGSVGPTGGYFPSYRLEIQTGKARFDEIHLARQRQGSGAQDSELWSATLHIVVQGFQPAQQGRHLAACQQGPGNLFVLMCRSLEILSAEKVTDRFGKVSFLLVPSAGPAVQFRHELRPFSL